MGVELKPPPSGAAARNDGGHKIVILLQVLILGGVAGLILLSSMGGREPCRSKESQEAIRKVASRLKAAGALDQAAALYERYLDSAGPGDRSAHMAYSLAQLYMQRGEYDKALRWLYQAEELGPGDLKQEIDEKVVHALEAMGRVHAAQAALDSRTRLDAGKPEHAENDPVVARIGKDEIRRSQVLQALDDLPPALKGQFSGKDGAARFLEKYVADELLYRKARKLEYHKDPVVERRLQGLLRELVAARFLEKELADKVEPDETALKNYYEAHRSRYDDPDRAKVRIIKVNTKEEALKLKKRIEKGASFADLASKHSLHAETKAKGGLLDRWVRRGEDFLGEGDPRVVADVVFNTPVGEVSDPTPAGGAYYLFLVEKREKGRKRTFEEVRARVERDYRTDKAASLYKEMIHDAMSAQDVELHPERMGSD